MENTNTKKTINKHDNFLRLAPARVDRVISALDALEKLSSKNYEYEADEVSAMFDAIDKRLSECISAYKGEKKAKKHGFSF